MTHTDNPNAALEFNVGDVVCISATGDRHQNMTGCIAEVQRNGTCHVHIPRTDANGLASDVWSWYSASQLKSGNVADLKPASAPDIFTRLEQKGISYEHIMQAIFLKIPDAELYYASRWKGKSFDKILDENERKRTLLNEQFEEYLPGHSQMDAALATSKVGLINQILVANPNVGDLAIRCTIIPHPILDDSDTREHAWPSFRITVFKQTAERTISPDTVDSAVPYAEALEEALKELGIWEILKNDRQLALIKEKFPNHRIDLLSWISANPRVGNLVIDCSMIPHPKLDDSDTRELASPSIRITVFKEMAERTIPPDTVANPVAYAEALEQALKELGIWEILRKDNPAAKLVNERAMRGWPIFTQFVIPALYEMMHPHYPARANYSEKIDGEAFEPQRPARAPIQLLRDMLDILKTERPDVFQDYDTASLKEVIRSYVRNKTEKSEER